MNRSRQQTFYSVCCDCADCLADEYQYSDSDPFIELTELFKTEREVRKAFRKGVIASPGHTRDSEFVLKSIIIQAEQRPRARKRQPQATTV